VRANLEHRYDTGLEFATGRFGLVAFYDNGWIGSGSDLGSPIASAGAGLRIGSKPLLGGGVVRIDFAKPFERAPGEDRDWTVSVSVGQVFTF
jgi:outer membrane translocation and assembly module TamA